MTKSFTKLKHQVKSSRYYIFWGAATVAVMAGQIYVGNGYRKMSEKVEDLTEAVKSMDAISLHMPLNEKTKNIINYNLLKTMRKNCIIINAARGGMINENDLDKALNESLIFGAGLDVFETEPPKEDNPLLKNNKVFLSPHTAAFTEECMIRMGKETIQNIIDFFEKNSCSSYTSLLCKCLISIATLSIDPAIIPRTEK